MSGGSGRLFEKPDEFGKGDRLSAREVNQIIRNQMRMITGESPIRVKPMGDRLMISFEQSPQFGPGGMSIQGVTAANILATGVITYPFQAKMVMNGQALFDASNHLLLVPYKGGQITYRYNGVIGICPLGTYLDVDLKSKLSANTNYDVYLSAGSSSGPPWSIYFHQWAHDGSQDGSQYPTVDSPAFPDPPNYPNTTGFLWNSVNRNDIYLGSIRGDADGHIQDNNGQRFLWNNFNKKRKSISYGIAGSFSTNSTTYVPYVDLGSNNALMEVLTGGGATNDAGYEDWKGSISVSLVTSSKSGDSNTTITAIIAAIQTNTPYPFNTQPGGINTLVGTQVNGYTANYLQTSDYAEVDEFGSLGLIGSPRGYAKLMVYCSAIGGAIGYIGSVDIQGAVWC